MAWSPVIVHRGFTAKCRQNRRDCTYLVKYGNYFLPRSFAWMEPANVEGLRAYIDALCTRNLGLSAPWEERGVAVDHVYETAPENVPMIWISPERMLALLRGEDPLQIPANAQLRITKQSSGLGRQLPTEIQAEVLANEGPLFDAYVAAVRRHAGTNAPLFYTDTPPKDQNTSIHLSNTGANLPSGAPAESAAASPTPAAPAVSAPTPMVAAPPARSLAEEPVSTVQHDGYEEIITHLRHAERPYFVRRLVVGQAIAWSGTAWLSAGPWVVHYENKAILDTLIIAKGAEVA